ncbi:hypothetical protein JZ751_016854 [Albula glossodonta]|uniref:Uncharacterized protein n=1 Tax=Albula glossodonta TaxID=121402 RepID=A0A8T2NXX6_9TELE|nr:hypothetical protein JZ751_016854 [Albula glossodonta]
MTEEFDEEVVFEDYAHVWEAVGRARHSPHVWRVGTAEGSDSGVEGRGKNTPVLITLQSSSILDVDCTSASCFHRPSRYIIGCSFTQGGRELVGRNSPLFQYLQDLGHSDFEEEEERGRGSGEGPFPQDVLAPLRAQALSFLIQALQYPPSPTPFTTSSSVESREHGDHVVTKAVVSGVKRGSALMLVTWQGVGGRGFQDAVELINISTETSASQIALGIRAETAPASRPPQRRFALSDERQAERMQQKQRDGGGEACRDTGEGIYMQVFVDLFKARAPDPAWKAAPLLDLAERAPLLAAGGVEEYRALCCLINCEFPHISQTSPLPNASWFPNCGSELMGGPQEGWRRSVTPPSFAEFLVVGHGPLQSDGWNCGALERHCCEVAITHPHHRVKSWVNQRVKPSLGFNSLSEAGAARGRGVNVSSSLNLGGVQCLTSSGLSAWGNALQEMPFMALLVEGQGVSGWLRGPEGLWLHTVTVHSVAVGAENLPRQPSPWSLGCIYVLRESLGFSRVTETVASEAFEQAPGKAGFSTIWQETDYGCQRRVSRGEVGGGTA